MELKLSILCILLGLAAAEPPPPGYRYRNYGNSDGASFGMPEDGGPSSDEYGQESSPGFSEGPYTGSAFGGSEGGYGGENEVKGPQGDDYGFDGGPSNSYEGGHGVSSYSPPSGEHDSYGGPPSHARPKRPYSPYSGLSMFLPKMPKIRINLPSRGPPKMPKASPSHFSYPSYVKAGGPQSSSPFESSYSGGGGGSYGGSEMSAFDTSPKRPGSGSSYEETPTGAYGAPSKGPHSSYEIPITYEQPSEGHGPPSSQYGGRPSMKNVHAYKPSNPYGSAPMGMKPGGYKNTPVSSPYKKPYSASSSPPSSYKHQQQAPELDEYGMPKHSPPMSSPGYMRGPSYTKYGPPVKGHTRTSQPIPMNSYGSDFGQGSNYEVPKSYGPPANDYLDPASNYNSQGSYQGGPGSNKYNDFEDENRYKRRPQSPSYGSSPMSSPYSQSRKPPSPRGKGYPSPSSGGYKPSSQSSHNNYDNYSNYGSSPQPEYNSPQPTSFAFGPPYSVEEDLSGF